MLGRSRRIRGPEGPANFPRFNRRRPSTLLSPRLSAGFSFPWAGRRLGGSFRSHPPRLRYPLGSGARNPGSLCTCLRVCLCGRGREGRFWVSIATAPVSPHCSQRFERLRVQIYIYLHVINIEAEPELVWASIPGQFRLLLSHPA